MKALLLVGGVLFLLLAVFLFIAAAIVFFVGRSRRARAAGPAPQPQVAPQQVAPPQAGGQFAPPPASPPAQPAAPDIGANATVVVDTRRLRLGAMHGTSGPIAGRSFPLDESGFFIGRDAAQAQVVIENPSVSKRHVWIGVRDGAVVAVDQSSTNGTYLNDTAHRIGEAHLTPGDTIIISDNVARLEYRV